MARKICRISATDTLWVLDDGKRHVVIGTDEGRCPTIFVATSEGWRMSGIRGLEPGTDVSDDAVIGAQIDSACARCSVQLWDPETYLGGRAALERLNGKGPR
jgi:hypothetical protein